MPAAKAPIDISAPQLTWQQLKGWINTNAWGLLEFAKAGFSERGRGMIILAGSPRFQASDATIKCRYIMPEEIADIDNEALDLAHQLAAKYDPETEFVVVTIDASNHVTSALVAVDLPTYEIVH
ncbi:MAG: hypothetical protein ACC647_01365 [Anaerolineales bacterium]